MAPSETPAAAANWRSASALPARSKTRPEDAPGEPAVDDLELVGGGEVDAEVGGDPVGDLREAAGDDGEPVAEPLQRADEGAGTRGEGQRAYTRSSAPASRPASSATRSRSDCLEVQLAAHRGLGDALHLLQAAGVRREHLDDLALHERRVDIHHDQAHAAPEQGRRLHGDVDGLCRGLLGERHPELVGVGAGDVQLDGGDGVARHALDAVDVRAGVGDAAGDRGDR